MEYKYPPLFKYIILLLCIFMFIKHLKIMSNKDNTILTISILIMVMIFDYIIIDDHPDLLGGDIEKITMVSDMDFVNDDVSNDVSDKDIEEILNTYDESEMQEYLDDVEKVEIPKKKSFYQLPTDEKKPTYDLDTDCYRRGDGRSNSEKVQKYYSKEIF